MGQRPVKWLHLNDGIIVTAGSKPKDRMQTSSSALTEELVNVCDCLERLSAEKLKAVPTSTYRFQFNSGFHFEDARRLLPYLEKLGIGACYASPILKARSGSLHGYDIIDHTQLNPEIGSEEDFRRLVSELKKRGMGLILDTVPNHMGVGAGDNPWWQDVLQNGRSSVYADFFDIDWEPLKPELRNKVLLPILGSSYGEELENAHITVRFEEGRFFVRYFDKVLPIDPHTIPLIFAPMRDAGATPEGLDKLLDSLRKLPANNITETDEVRRRRRDLPELLVRLEKLARASQLTEYIARSLQALNGKKGDQHSFDALHCLLEAQAYRLAFWRVSGEEINYRRFFDINDLVGLRTEDPAVFAETHKLIRRLMRDQLISGLRIDHPDGLLNPTQYFVRLQKLYVASRCVGAKSSAPTAADGIELEVHSAFRDHPDPLYLLVEKILEPGENLSPDWPVDGSVGYDFTNLVNGVFIDSRSERAFDSLYQRVIGTSVSAGRLIYESKRLVMSRALASELNVLAHMLNAISNEDRRARDFTWSVLREAIRETIAFFPVYRTYIDERARVSNSDRHYIQQAIARAKRHNTSLAPAVFDFLRSILLLESTDEAGTIHGYRKRLYFTLKFQQLTGPVMAKGLEDTACYVYSRFIAVNEVGGSPEAFGMPVEQFHCASEERARNWPHSMLSTSTHDTKRSEDVRARLDVLSEIPKMWAEYVMKWRRINRSRKVTLADGRQVPDNNEEYFLYQTLVGAWPLAINHEDDRKEFVSRIQQYMEKAAHEAKVNVSWLNPNPDYIAGMNSFIEAILSPKYRGRPNLFWDSMQRILSPVAFFGCVNSLSQLLLKLTVPGMPDIYQGQELWDFSLVDPDNRRPVDFDLRLRVAGELWRQREGTGQAKLCRDMLKNYRDGRMKFWVTMKALNFRREYKGLYQLGNYIPLHATHGKEDHVIAFARERGGVMAITAVPRLALTLMKGREEPPTGTVWNDSELLLPAHAANKTLLNVLTGERIHSHRAVLCREVFASFPVALLVVE